MFQKNAGLGSLYIALGGLLLFSVIGTWMMKVALAFLGFYLVNYGLAMRGIHTFNFRMLRWFDRTRYY